MLLKRISVVLMGVWAITPTWAEELKQEELKLDEVVVWGKQQDSRQVGYTSPVSTVKPAQISAINAATTEDIVKYEPSIVIRRRFIGDSNGTLGLRGANMFQTSRSMVFADGVPLHYFLESRWNGAPRWTMVSASEIAQANLAYGPFSAEHGGNAMGGVVQIETKIPQKREVHIDGSLFSQAYSGYNFSDRLNGYKGFASYGDKIGNLSVYLSYNRLDNDGQPQTFYANPISSKAGAAVSGGFEGKNAKGETQMYYGNTGVAHAQTDNYKMKLAYDFGNSWLALLNVAYEDRVGYNSGNTYVVDDNGAPVWSGDVNQAGQGYAISASNLGKTNLERNSLNLGLRLKGDINANTHLEVNTSVFDVQKDKTRTSSINPAAPTYNNKGQITDYGDTGWQTVNAKVKFDQLGKFDTLNLTTGISNESYELNRDVYQSDNLSASSKDALNSSSGGKTNLTAAYAQLGWLMTEKWDSSFGLRYEDWQSKGGYYFDNKTSSIVKIDHRSENRFSPKASIGFLPNDRWVLRYSLAKAYRFPIIEELYSQYQAYQSKSLANPSLAPETGLHQNLMIEHSLANGYLRANLFRDDVANTIESQSATVVVNGQNTSVRTFVPVDKVLTTGIELIANVNRVADSPVDLHANVTYTDAEIKKNSADTNLEGKTFPRTPHLRGNLLATWHVNPKWDMSGSMQYTSDSFGQLDNADREDKVYGAIDAYTIFGVKAAYKLNQNFALSFGVDNLTNETAYVAHPWPKRTMYLNGSYDW